MASNSQHSLDISLSQFDDFFNERYSTENLTNTVGLVYAFSPKSNEANVRFDLCSLRTYLIASYVHELCKIQGSNFAFGSSPIDLFPLVEQEFDVKFRDNIINSDQPDEIDYRDLLRKSATENECGCGTRCLDVSSISTDKTVDRRFRHIPILCNDQFSHEAAEATKIMSILSNVGQPGEIRLIVVVADDCNRLWASTRRLLDWISSRTDQLIKISTITVGRVIFTNDWASSIDEYFGSRRKLIDSSYRHKFATSGRDETDVPLKNRRALTFASVVFELMAYPFKNALIIEEIAYRSAGGDQEQILPQWARNGVFVTYNYARLSAVLSKYHQGASCDRYPKFLALDRLNDQIKSKIREEMTPFLDWLSYVSTFGVSHEEVAKFPNLRSDLFEFSRRFSRYYSKKRVLTESVAFSQDCADALIAKIHVLERLRNAYLFCFRLLSISAIDIV